MNEDNELQRMFEALRSVDERLVPSFDELTATSPAVHRLAQVESSRVRLRQTTAVVAMALSACVVIGLAGWIQVRRSEGPVSSPAAAADLQQLHRLCDSLLARIEVSQSDDTSVAAQQEMVWRTQTDALLPFDSLDFDERKSP